MKLLILIFLFLGLHTTYAQSFFEIKALGNKYAPNEITAAFESADFCGSFYLTKRNKIVLDDGTIVELKFQQELIDAGVNSFSTTCFMNDTEVYFEAIWSIDPSGRLMKGFDTEKYPSHKEYIHLTN